MGYEVHIERRAADGQRSPISLDEWSTAVQHTDGVRLASGELRAPLPRSAGQVVVPLRQGDTEVFFPEAEDWHVVFVWSASGSAFFSGQPDFLDEHSVVRKAARALAKRLDAVLVGDTGQRYD